MRKIFSQKSISTYCKLLFHAMTYYLGGEVNYFIDKRKINPSLSLAEDSIKNSIIFMCIADAIQFKFLLRIS